MLINVTTVLRRDALVDLQFSLFKWRVSTQRFCQFFSWSVKQIMTKKPLDIKAEIKFLKAIWF